MRFRCGDSDEVVAAKAVAAQSRLENWHDFFPLFPRTIGQENGKDICMWLEIIERKGRVLWGFDGCFWVWDYRAKQRGAARTKKEKVK